MGLIPRSNLSLLVQQLLNATAKVPAVGAAASEESAPLAAAVAAGKEGLHEYMAALKAENARLEAEIVRLAAIGSGSSVLESETKARTAVHKLIKVVKKLPHTQADALAAAEQLLAAEEQAAAQAAVTKQKQKVKKQQQNAKKHLSQQHQQGQGAAFNTCTSAPAVCHTQTLPHSIISLKNHVGAKAAGTNITSSSHGAVLVDPVIAAHGHTYERSAMEQWIAAQNTSPDTGQPLKNTCLVTNMAAKCAVATQAMCLNCQAYTLSLSVECWMSACVPEALSFVIVTLDFLTC
ncbi:TPA: hypothetical protein ACH3X1_008038 [Trebouxia sp. C0004]